MAEKGSRRMITTLRRIFKHYVADESRNWNLKHYSSLASIARLKLLRLSNLHINSSQDPNQGTIFVAGIGP
jgi:hypothetical protein